MSKMDWKVYNMCLVNSMSNIDCVLESLSSVDVIVYDSMDFKLDSKSNINYIVESMSL